jgi:hypothetical protein
VKELAKSENWNKIIMEALLFCVVIWTKLGFEDLEVVNLLLKYPFCVPSFPCSPIVLAKANGTKFQKKKKECMYVCNPFRSHDCLFPLGCCDHSSSVKGMLGCNLIESPLKWSFASLLVLHG